MPRDYWFGSYAGSEEDYVAQFGAASKSNFVFHPGDSITDAAKEVATLNDGADIAPPKSAGKSKKRS